MAAAPAARAVRIADSRRLTGPSLLLDHPGAVLEIEARDVDAAALAAAWRTHLASMRAALGWTDGATAWRAWPGGVTLAFEAPAEALYAATEVNEWALAQVRAELGVTTRGDTVLAQAVADPAVETFAGAVERLRASAARERDPRREALAAAATAHGVTLLADDRRVSLGLGTGSRSWPVESAPEPKTVPWRRLHDVPVALVTGTNGKSTTVRLLAAMVRAAGRVAGSTSTDRVEVGDEVVAVGDYSGPNGARTVLRDRRVEIGLLEVARGGILRRGLPVPHARTAVVTNVAADHLGEYGIFDVDALADAKLVVAKAVDREGRVVLNADDPRLLARGARLASPVTWFTLDPAHPVLAPHLDSGGEACVLEGDDLVFHRGSERRPIAGVGDAPVTLGGAARHNVANALAAIGAASALGLDPTAIAAGLAAFASTPDANPGRANTFRIGDVTAIVDFAHNPHGLAALAAMAARLPAARRALVIGQAGDRDDDAIAEFARTAWSMRPDRVFVKEMEIFLRGRERGIVPALIERALRDAGAETACIEHHATELDAMRAALTWARPGDLLVLTTHADRERVLALMRELADRDWRPGKPLP